MKLNPFSKKSTTGYYDRIKVQHDQLNREVTELRKELAEAKEEYTQLHEKRSRIIDAAGPMSMNTPPAAKAMWPAVNAAYQRMGQLESSVSSLEGRIHPLSRVLQAPEEFASAQKKLDDLVAQDRATTAEIERLDKLIAKINQRNAVTEARIAAETQSAAKTMQDVEGEFIVPESLIKAETELRLGQASLADLQAKKEAIITQRHGLPKAIQEATRTFINCRAAVAEIELYEQLVPVMSQLARASAAKGECRYGGSHRDTRFEVEIPEDLIESAKAALASEIPTA